MNGIKKSRLGWLVPVFLFAAEVNAQPGVAVTTAQFDNSRTGANLDENTLDTSNVNVSRFGKLYSFPVTGQVYAQPLYVPHVAIAGPGPKHNVLYVATMHNVVYAFDANDAARAPFFEVNLGPPVPAGLAGRCPSGFITGPELGVLSTPVIDLDSGTLYVVSATPSQDGTGYIHRLFALDMLTGQLKYGSPVVIAAAVPGTAPDQSGGQVVLNQTTQIQRTGLLLASGNVYAAFGGCGPDPEPYHGWIAGYNARTLAQIAVFNDTPNGQEGGIWQSGRGLVSDAAGFVYGLSGNGDNSSSDFGDSFLKLDPIGDLVDWFTPANYPELEFFDLDLSSSGPLLLPDVNLLVGGGKEGVVYVLDPLSLGRAGTPVQQFQATAPCGDFTFNGCFHLASMAYANNMLYVWGWNDVLRAYRLVNGRFETTPVSTGKITATYPGGFMAVSWHKTQKGTGVLWAVTPDNILHAFDATDAAVELWNSNQNPGRDSLGPFAKFGQPVVADGIVFVPTFGNAVVAYGLLPRHP